jgi:hypothetical protein
VLAVAAVGVEGSRCWRLMSYPTDQAGRQQLADELTAKGLMPTQTKHHFDRGKIDRMADAMRNGTFDWSLGSLQPVVLGPSAEVIGGHHRVIAAHLAGIDSTTVQGAWPQVRRLPFNYRPVFNWIDVLPDVP